MRYQCEVQARVRDLNTSGHVDNIAVMRILDEARVLFLSELTRVKGEAVDPARAAEGLAGAAPGVNLLVVGQRVEYRQEMYVEPGTPFRVEVWLAHIGRSSIAMDFALRIGVPDDAPAQVVGETSAVLMDAATSRPWSITDAVRSILSPYLEDPLPLRERAAGS